MAAPDQSHDDAKRSYLLPEGCKDLLDAIKKEAASVPPPVSYPPITRRIRLPQKVAVRFLAEISGQELHVIMALMNRLRIVVDINRSVDFDHAQRILGRQGTNE
jgi:hypothetical protein